MALWLFRAGSRGEYETKFLNDKRVYITWQNLNHDLSKLHSRKELMALLDKTYPDNKPKALQNYVSQVWPAVHDMKPGDWIVLPSKLKSAIHIAEITGGYEYDSKAEDPFYHSRTVNWIATDISRANFDQDLLYSMGAFLTICRIERNDAEARIRAMKKAGWKSGTAITKPTNTHGQEDVIESVDLEQLARDQIAKLIIQKFKGHGLARLVESILKAQGYTTYISPVGPDKGIDILAAPGPLGFGKPRLCVQVKSSDLPVDLPTMNQLIGAMQNVHADQGLLVSWGGFKSSIDKEVPAQFFRVRLWDQDKLIVELLDHYEALEADLRADIPLKKIWTVATKEDDT